jgi:hypothetical protein
MDQGIAPMRARVSVIFGGRERSCRWAKLLAGGSSGPSPLLSGREFCSKLPIPEAAFRRLTGAAIDTIALPHARSDLGGAGRASAHLCSRILKIAHGDAVRRRHPREGAERAILRQRLCRAHEPLVAERQTTIRVGHSSLSTLGERLFNGNGAEHEFRFRVHICVSIDTLAP